MEGKPAKEVASAAGQPSRPGADWWAPLLLGVVSLTLRIYRIDQGLWSDEIGSSTQYFHAAWLDLVTTFPNPTHHPLYSLLAKASILLLGESEWTLRLPALISGALTPPALYYLGRRLGGRAVGLLAGGLLVFSMWHVWFSQDARGYSTMLLFSVIASVLFLRLRQEWSPTLAAGYALATLASVYAHLYGVMVPLAHLLLAATAGWRRREWRLPATVAAALLLCAAAYAPLAAGAWHYAHAEGHADPSRSLGPGFLLELVEGWSIGDAPALLALPFLALAAAGLVRVARRDRFQAWFLLLPLALGIGFAAVTRTFVYHRFFLYGLPGFLILAATGAEAAARWSRRPRLLLPLLAALLVCLTLPGLVKYYRLGKQPLRDVARWVDTQPPGTVAYTAGMANWVFRTYCSYALPLPPGPPRPEDLRRAVVVVAHPWSAGRGLLLELKSLCGPPTVWPAAGYRENEVLVFDCQSVLGGVGP